MSPTKAWQRRFAALRWPGIAARRATSNKVIKRAKSAGADGAQAGAGCVLGRLFRLFRRSRRPSVGGCVQSRIADGATTGGCKIPRTDVFPAIQSAPVCTLTRSSARRTVAACVTRLQESRAPRLPLNEPELRPSFRRERRALINRGIWPVAGCDEAGRGPLAGPVVAAAVVLDPDNIPRGLNDSKKLDAGEREKLYAKICASAHVVGRLRLDRAHRPRQYPARLAVGAGARGRRAAGAAEARLRRRQHEDRLLAAIARRW